MDTEISLQNIRRHLKGSIERRYRNTFGSVRMREKGIKHSNRPYTSDSKCAVKIINIQINISIEKKDGDKVFKSYPKLKKHLYWGNHFWSSGNGVDTVGQYEDKIRKYLKYLEDKEKKEEQQGIEF